MRTFFFLVVVCLTSAAWASTNVVMNIMLQQPMPHSFAVWQQNDRNLVVVTIQNFDPVSYPNIRLSGLVKDEDHNKIVAHTNDNDPNMPRFTIPASPALNVPGVLVLRGRDCINANSIIIDATLKSQAISTNSLPEGNFSFCVKLLKEDNTELPYTGNGCSSFGVVLADPPVLIAPDDKMALQAGSFPVFTWSQVGPVPPGTMITYWLKIVPLFAAQTPRDAIDHNEVLLRVSVPMTTYQYLPSNLSFATYSTAVGFAWQVQALDETGQPITSNEGRSDIHTFHFTTPPALVPPAPPDGDKNVSGGRKKD